MEKLIYIGDNIRLSQDLGVVSNITNLEYSLSSTQEDLSNVTLLYERVDIKFRVSKEDDYYSDWYSLKDIEDNTLSYSNVYVDTTFSTTVEVEFTLIDIPNTWDEDDDFIEVSSINVTGSSTTSNIDYIPNAPVVSAIGNNSYTYENNFTYNPYDLDQVSRLQNDLSMATNEIYGHQAEYIKVNPLEKGKDFIYHEWNLFGVTQDDIKCLKVLVSNNEFQVNGFLFNQFGMNFTDSLEVHISHQYFQRFFGIDKVPQERDILYIPIANRMYEVSGTQAVKNINLDIQYWKLTLSKYEKRSNILLDSDTKDKIYDNAKGLEDLFNPISDPEAKDIAIETQTQYNKPKNLNIRNFVNSRIGYTNDTINSYFTIVSEDQYNLQPLHSENRTLAVTYKQQFTNKINEGSTLTFISYLYNVKSTSVNVTLTDQDPLVKIELATGLFNPTYSVGTILTVYKRVSNSKFVKGYVKISSIANDKSYILVSKLNNFDISEISLISITNCKDVIVTGLNTYAKETKIRSFQIDNPNQKFHVSILDNHSVYVEYFGNEYLFLLDSKLENETYYSFVLSLNSMFKTIGLYIYEFNNQNTEEDLLEVYRETKEFVNVTKTSNGLLSLVGSPMRLTNIRLFSKPLDQDIHKQYLTKKYIDNDGEIIIFDNGTKELALNDYDYGGLK